MAYSNIFSQLLTISLLLFQLIVLNNVRALLDYVSSLSRLASYLPWKSRKATTLPVFTGLATARLVGNTSPRLKIWVPFDNVSSDNLLSPATPLTPASPEDIENCAATPPKIIPTSKLTLIEDNTQPESESLFDSIIADQESAVSAGATGNTATHPTMNRSSSILDGRPSSSKYMGSARAKLDIYESINRRYIEENIVTSSATLKEIESSFLTLADSKMFGRKYRKLLPKGVLRRAAPALFKKMRFVATPLTIIYENVAYP